MTSSLDLVKRYMSSWGWSDGGAPGSVKRDANKNTVAFHGDMTWQADVELACVALMSLANAPKTTLS